MDEDLQALEQLEREEQALLVARAQALETALTQSSRDAERCLDAVKRALPELDLVAKTAGELRASIHKTMERADVVSVKVRELDLSRSRALEALNYAKKCQEARNCVKGARQALGEREVEIAAGYVQRFDELASAATPPNGGGASKREQFGSAAEDMLQIRNELERSILFNKDGAAQSTVHGHASAAAAAGGASALLGENWLEAPQIKEALKHANVMSKVASDDASAEIRYAHFLASCLKERVQAYLAQKNLTHSSLQQQQQGRGEERAYIEAFKFLFNSSCALIESQLAVKILSKRSKPLIFRAVHAECDKQCTMLFDLFLSARRVHERSSSNHGVVGSTTTAKQMDERDLAKLNQLLTEMCIIMQHVESYDRFTRSLSFDFVQQQQQQPPLPQPEYKRVIQEVAGAYTMLERIWLTESLKRARLVEQICETTHLETALALPLQVSTIVEDAFYLCKRAVKRGLGTGSCDAACGCINQVAGCLEDALFAALVQRAAVAGGEDAYRADAAIMVQLNSLELASHYSHDLHEEILQTMVKTFERAEELEKTRGCSESLADLGKQLDYQRLEALQRVLAPVFAQWKQAIFTDALGPVSYNVDEASFTLAGGGTLVEQDFTVRLVGQFPALQKRFQVSEASFQLLCELVSQRIAEELERGIVVKPFSQLGALQLEHDLREIIEALCSLATNSFTVRKMFARLLQITSLLSISTLGEAHDVWDAFALRQTRQQEAGNARAELVVARSGLTAKEAKRILPLRVDFKQKEVQQLKLL